MLSLLFTSCLLVTASTPDGGNVTLKGRTLLAEVVRTEKERERGLAYRSSFKSERCLFVVSENEGLNPVRTAKFLLPFDVVWVDGQGLIIEVGERLPPCKTGMDCPEHGGAQPSRYHLFLAAGMVRRLGIRLGDKDQWDLHFSDGTRLRNNPPVPANRQPAVKGKRP